MRKTTFTHKSGGVVDLPLLVPSFSSKGFGYFSEKKGQKKQYFSETTTALEALGTFLEESYLLSAYDLHNKHFRKPERFFENTSLLLLDSGGYELAPEFDSSEPKLTPIRKLPPFSRTNYVSVLRSLQKKHASIPFVIANYDWGTDRCSFEEQIRDARELFRPFPNWSTNFILKPNKSTRRIIDVNEVVPVISELRKFDIIGVTEKELGRNLIDRLKKLVQLRIALSDQGVDAPIHVWGGLDPIVTPLYFFAGADVFDGISWLRYAYYEGVAVNLESYTVLKGNLTVPRDHSVALAHNDNLVALQGLATSMRSFASSEIPNFGLFNSRSELFEKAYESMKAKVPQIKELP